MKMTLALASVIAFLCTLAPASDKDKKDEKSKKDDKGADTTAPPK